MHRIFQRFVDQILDAPTSDALREAMTDAATALNLSYFAYLSLPRNSKTKPYLISNYPSVWTTHYLKHRYESFDPVIIRAFLHPDPFEWGIDVNPKVRSVSQQELFEEAARFGIRHGFTVPIHDNVGSVAAVTFASNDRLPPFERSISKHNRVLQLMAIYFHSHVLRRTTLQHGIDGPSLSPRELECIQWSAQGKSAWEIGFILGISRHTVATYIENAKTKLGVRTIVQAVAQLTEIKLIK